MPEKDYKKEFIERLLRRAIVMLAAVLLPAVATARRSTLFNSNQKLSSSFVNQVYQDASGVVWVATKDGLNRYDGYNFHAYTTADGLTGNNILCVAQDKQGVLYVGTSNGLCYRTLNGFRPVDNEETSESTNYFTTQLCEGPDGNIYIGTSGRGLRVITSEGKERGINIENEGIAFCHSMCFDNNGTLWFSSDSQGIFALRKRKGNTLSYEIIGHYNPLEQGGYAVVAHDTKNNIYIGYLGGGIMKLNRSTNTFEPVAGTSTLSVSAMLPSHDGNLYVGTDGNGLKILNTADGTISDSDIHNKDITVSKTKVYSIFEDKMHNLWLGLLQKGVLLVTPSPYEFHYLGYQSPTDNVIGEACVSAVFKQRNGMLWVAPDRDGLYCVSGTTRHFTPNIGSASAVPATVLTMTEDAKGRLWVGSYTEGCGWVDAASGAYHRASFSYGWDQGVFDMRATRDGKLWIGSLGGGVKLYDPETDKVLASYLVEGNTVLADGKMVENKKAKGRLTNNFIMQMDLTANEEWLFVGMATGLACLHIPTQDFTVLDKDVCMLDGQSIRAMRYSPEVGLWVGTNDGLFHIDVNLAKPVRDPKITRYGKKDGLLEDQVSSLEIDSKQRIWISGNTGMCCFDPKSGNVDYYYGSDGLQGNEFSEGVSYTDANGTIYFGGVAGVSFFDPTKITAVKHKHTVSLMRISVASRSVKPGMESGWYTICEEPINKSESFDFCHDDNTITLLFSTLTYSNVERISFAYSINDGEWVTLPAGQNDLTLSSLQPGDYKIRVVAIDNGERSDEKEFTIVIHNPWYFTPLARVFYFILLLAAIGWYIHTLRVRNRQSLRLQAHIHAEEMNEQKLRFFINMSHEIRTPMTLIVTPLQKLIHEDHDSHRQATYEVMRRNAERILHLVNQIMDLRKIDKGQMTMQMRETDIVAFVGDIMELFRLPAAAKGITVNYTHEIQALPAWIDRGQFDKVIMNLMSNALKYTQNGGEIRVTLEQVEDGSPAGSVRLTVFDNGEKIPESALRNIFDRFYQTTSSVNQNKAGTGVGLDLTRSLVHLHHGEIAVRNVEDGVEFTVTLPLGNAHLKPEEIATGEEEVQTESLLFTNDNISSINDLSLPWEQKEATDKTEATEATPRGKKPLIVVVEDDYEIRDFLVNDLSQTYQVLGFPDGADALPVILREIPQLILSDVMMPKMDGTTLCSKVKQNINTNHIPVILLTAKTRDEDRLQGLETGADLYVTKPFNMDILRRNIANLINSRRILQNKFEGKEDQKEKIDDVELQTIDERLMKRIMAVINANLHNSDLNIDMVCSEVGISRVHLHRKMKELTNQTPHDFIRNLRLKQAARLLSHKGQSITEVMFRCGFNSATSFSTMFKKMYGVSPREYMKEHNEDKE